MATTIFTLLLATLIYSQTFASKSEQKCLEFSKLFDEKLQRSTIVGESSSLGKEPTAPDEFPHMAALGYDGPSETEWLCGGSLIDQRHVLTSAVCTKGPHGPVSKVRFGDHNIQSANDDGHIQEIAIKQIFTHPGYGSPEVYNDIAVLKLEHPVKFSEKVRPVCLYERKDWPAGEEVSAAGWGKTNFGDLSSPTLSKVYLDYFNDKECDEIYDGVDPRRLPKGVNSNMHICAGGRNKPRDTCKGDAGGPMHYLDKTKNNYFLVGIASFGKSCGVPNIPSVYTRISTYVPWIETIAWS